MQVRLRTSCANFKLRLSNAPVTALNETSNETSNNEKAVQVPNYTNVNILKLDLILIRKINSRK